MAVRSAAVIHGARKPLEVDFTSSMALPFGTEPSELMPTLWAFVAPAIANRMAAIRSVLRFFIWIEVLIGVWQIIVLFIYPAL